MKEEKQYENNPLTPHLQIYRWHISSLLSITNRIIGIVNFFVKKQVLILNNSITVYHYHFKILVL